MSHILKLEKNICDLNKLLNRNKRFINRMEQLHSKRFELNENRRNVFLFLTCFFGLFPFVLLAFLNIPSSVIYSSSTVAAIIILIHYYKERKYSAILKRMMDKRLEFTKIEGEKEQEIKLFIKSNINNLFEELEEIRKKKKIEELSEYIVDEIIKNKKEELKNKRDYYNEVDELSKENKILKLRKEELEYELEIS